jgi:hypothetical protein
MIVPNDRSYIDYHMYVCAMDQARNWRLMDLVQLRRVESDVVTVPQVTATSAWIIVS